MKKSVGGLTHTIGDIEEGHLNNIAQMASADPAAAATARLNRDLVNVIERWIENEAARGLDALAAMTAAMHGVTTVCGTILLNAPDAVHDEVAQAMREHLLRIFDAMLAAVGEHKQSEGDK
ncbi:MAG TPA: hypothetical protein VNK48_14425 [Xanthobacteraceae bacterium]|nr:hypothetical protein [Xanthobacteraceae bacterium]